MSHIPKITITVGGSGCNSCGGSLILDPQNGGCGCGTPACPVEDDTPNSPCTHCDGTCEDIWPTDCVLYAGADIPQLGISKSDKLTKIVILMAAEILALKARVATLEA